MLRKRPQQMIGKLTELLVSGGRAVEVMGSPRGPLDTTRGGGGIKSYDLGGVGLKIVVALDDDKGEVILPKKHAVCTSKLNHRSGPIPVKNPIGFQRDDARDKNDLQSSLEEEEYTYVTCHVPNKSFTKVYYDDGGYNNVGVLTTPQLISPYPTSNFLSSCHLCGKNLHGKDIYMYRGEKAFCSTECRSSQIMMDERKERCASEAASRSGELSSSPYNNTTRGDQIFSTGILAI